MNAGIGSAGLTSVWNSPITSPPRTLTAPTSVMCAAAGLPPVVSRSTTTKVTADSAVPSSSSVPWTPCMVRTVGAGPDRPAQARPRDRRGRRRKTAGQACQTVLLTSLLRSRPEAQDEQEEDER